MAGMFDDHIPHEEKIAELKREVAMRRVVYDRRVADKRMTRNKADRQIGIIEAIIADYEEGRVART